MAGFCDAADVRLRACFTMEEIAGVTIPDGSGSHNDAVVTSSLFRVPGRQGLALACQPDTQVNIPEAASLDGQDHVTVDTWVNPAEHPAAGMRAGLVDNDGQYGMFLMSGGGLGCSSDGAQLMGGVVPLNAWTHVRCAWNAGVVEVVINGATVAMGPFPVPLVTSVTVGTNLGSNAPSGDHFVGLLDCTRIWIGPLTAAELASLHTDCVGSD